MTGAPPALDGSVVVTGATGFVGRHVCRVLGAAGLTVRPAVRRAGGAGDLGGVAAEVVVGDLDDSPDWQGALSDVAALVHLAHPISDGGARALMQAAVEGGVGRVVWMSSVKAMAESTSGPQDLLDESSTPAPTTSYGRIKLDQEGMARRLAEGGCELVVLRPPLVHGPGARGGLAKMVAAVRAGWPLPLGSIRNARSLIGVDNLADAVLVCLTHPAAAGRTFLLSDGAPVSTPELVRTIGQAAGRPARLLPVPAGLLSAAGALTGRSQDARRVLGSLPVDDRAIRDDLGWHPARTLVEGLRRMVGVP